MNDPACAWSTLANSCGAPLSHTPSCPAHLQGSQSRPICSDTANDCAPRLNRRFAAKSNRDVREDCGLFTAGTLTRSWMVLWATHSVRGSSLIGEG